MKIYLEIAGILMLLLALFHIGFPGYFRWKQQLKHLSLINRQMMYAHAFFIGLVILLMGLLCIYCADDLAHTPLGKQVCLGLGLFWICRLIFQIFGYSTLLWKGKLFETAVHIVFTLFWTYLSAIFLFTFFATNSS
ncbi:hypothetical protein GCM10027051_10890 [Niabella terrae]